MDGSRQLDTTKGKLEVAIGRFGDVVDGFAARKLHQSSDAGAIADAASDKAGMAMILGGMWHHDIAPKPILASMAVRHAINAGATLYHGFHDDDKRAMRPPKTGKYAMAADNVALLAFAAADECDKNSKEYRAMRKVGWIAAGAGLLLGIPTAIGYIRGNFDVAKEDSAAPDVAK